MSFQAYNMIPSHGIRSGFGIRHAVFFSCLFFFVSWLLCMWLPKNFLWLGPHWVEKSLVCVRKVKAGPCWGCGFQSTCRCFRKTDF